MTTLQTDWGFQKLIERTENIEIEVKSVQNHVQVFSVV